MRTTRLAPVLLACAAALATAPAGRAQEEPPLIQEPAPPVKPPAAPPAAAPSAPAPAPAPGARLRPALDFPRWQEMTARERQTFVEGAVMALTAVATRMRTELGPQDTVTAERLAAEVRFVRDIFPRFPVSDYLREMEHIYLTAEGQNLSMTECFWQAFRRINGR